MLAANARRFQFTGRPIKPLRQLQSPFARHGAQNGELFGTRLLIRKHDGTVRRKTRPSKLFAFPVVVATEVTRFKFVSAFSISDFRFFVRASAVGCYEPGRLFARVLAAGHRGEGLDYFCRLEPGSRHLFTQVLTLGFVETVYIPFDLAPVNSARQRLVTWLAIPVLTIGIFTMDLFTPRGLSDWVWYFIPLLLSSYVSNRFLPFLLTSVFTVLSVAGYFLPAAGGTTAYLSFTSRCMGICVLWLVAWLISQRQGTEERVQEQAELLDLAHDAILVQDLEDHVLYWNKSAERIYGWTAPEALGRKTSELLRNNGFKFDETRKIILETGVWSGELTCRTKSGREVVVEARWTLVRNRHGEPKAILSINTDITDRKKLQEQLLRSQRLQSIGTLAGGIAHDLNNILTPLMMSVALLKDKTNGDPESKSLLATLEANVQRGAALVQQVLAFGRGVSGARVAVNPVQVVREIERIVHETFPKSVHFELSLNPELWAMTGDSTQLHQVLLNLCLNARDAMPNGGRLSIQMENTILDETYVNMHLEATLGAYLVIKVTDTGAGIPPELQDKIFEPFFTTKEVGKGTGLGLPSVLAIVKSHGGFINFYSEAGQGSTFKIYLPASTTPGAAEIVAVDQTQLPRGRNEVVLVVDDEEPIRSTAKKLLERSGYRVLLAENGGEAVSLYAQRKNEIAVVLTDMAMPVMDGVATIVALKSLNPSVKIISSSGLAANGAVAKASGVGVQHFIPKPYTAEVMLQTVHKILHENPTV